VLWLLPYSLEELWRNRRLGHFDFAGPSVTDKYQLGPWRSPRAHLHAGFPQVHIPLRQRSTENLAHRRKFRQSYLTLPQGQFGEAP